MSNLIKKAGRNVVYFLNEIFWKPEGVLQDYVVEKLRIHGLNTRCLNRYLDETDVPLSVGRFPKILSDYSRLMGIIESGIDNFTREEFKKNDGIQK